METTNDIVREMREFADTDSQSIGRDVLRRRIHKFADLIKKAHEFELAVEKAKAAGEGYAAGKQSVTDCNQHETVDIVSRCIYGEAKDAEPVGNAAKMREALVKSRKAMDEISKSIFQGWIEDSLVNVAGEAQMAISAALSAPPRNCDLYKTLDDARNAFFADYVPDETCSSATAFAMWLFDEEKGATE